MAIPPALLAQGAQQGLGAIMGLAGGLMQKRSRKKAMRKMEKEAAKTRERFEQKASDARSSFRGSLRTIEALKTSGSVEFDQARSTAARLQKSALQNRQLSRRGGLPPEAQAQLLGMGNMQEYLAERAGRMENVQRLTQMEAGIVAQQQQISAEILKTGEGAASVWTQGQAGLLSQPDEIGAAVAGAGSAMASKKMDFKGVGQTQAPSSYTASPQTDPFVFAQAPAGMAQQPPAGIGVLQPQFIVP